MYRHRGWEDELGEANVLGLSIDALITGVQESTYQSAAYKCEAAENHLHRVKRMVVCAN